MKSGSTIWAVGKMHMLKENVFSSTYYLENFEKFYTIW